MKPIEKPPDWFEIIANNVKDYWEPPRREQIFEIVKSTNEKYIYWDKFKFQSFPEDISPEVAWAHVKMSRAGQMRKLENIADINGLNFGYWFPDFVLQDLHFIDQNSGGQILIDSPNIEAERDRYLISSLMEEAIASSILEGAATTREKAKAMLREGRKPKDRSEQMVVNNYATMKDLKRYVREPLTPELIMKIQALITRNTLENEDASGRFKKEGEENEVVDIDGKVIFVPPPISEIEKRIGSLCEFANSDQTFIHPVIKAIILHFALAYIHPFVDGNGRTARSLFYWYMLKKEYWMVEFLSISRILLKAPAQYVRAYLYSEMDEGDMTYFIKYHLKAVCLAIKDLKEYLKSQQKRIDESNSLLRKYPGLNHRQRDLIQHALYHPYERYSVEYYKNMQHVVYQTARTDLLNLTKKKFLTKGKDGKKYYFFPSKKIHSILKEK